VGYFWCFWVFWVFCVNVCVCVRKYVCVLCKKIKKIDDYDREYEEREQNRWDSGYYDERSDDDRYDDRYDYSEPEPDPECDDCGEYCCQVKDGRCSRCHRNVFTVVEMKTPLPIVTMDIVFSYLDIKINHDLRRRENKSRKLCWRFKRSGRCRFGDACRFVHVHKIPKLCFHYLKGNCHFGEFCHFHHKSLKVCRQFKKGKRCRYGSRCRYLHTHQKVCRHFLKGKCWFGKRCRNFHYSL